ncbi:MAG TPA: hypothetical protein VGK32_12630 [Vicinamibacterales bacterium]|jgi:hypothetical protein
MALNSHFVSRFLTEPWEHDQRELWYYDFDRGELRSQSSRSLFAREGVHSSEIEARLNRYIETPIAAARARLWASVGDVSQQLEWPLFRALSLLLLLQPLRATDALDGPATVEDALSKPERDIDGLASAIGDRYRLMRITVNRRAPLYYPADGWFPLVGTPNGGTCPLGIAIPLSDSHAFIGVRSSVDLAQTEAWTINGAGIVSNYSVGYRSSKVVVHPDAVNHVPEHVLVDAIRSARAGVEQGIALCAELARLVERMDDMYRV